MADPGFDGRVQLSESFVVSRKEKQRIVSEAVFAAAAKRDKPGAGAAHDVDDALTVHQGGETAVTRLAFFKRHAAKRPQQFGVISFIHRVCPGRAGSARDLLALGREKRAE